MDADRLWREHMDRPFPPGLAGEEVEGVDLVSLDSATAGLIATVLGSRGRLSAEQVSELEMRIGDCGVVADRLRGRDQGYFNDLAHVARVVLRSRTVLKWVGGERRSDGG